MNYVFFYGVVLRMSDTATTAPMRHVDMLRLFPVRVHFARDLKAMLEPWGTVSATAIQGWEDRDNIPERYWPAIIALAQTQGHPEINMQSLRDATKLPRNNRRRGRPRHLAPTSSA